MKDVDAVGTPHSVQRATTPYPSRHIRTLVRAEGPLSTNLPLLNLVLYHMGTMHYPRRILEASICFQQTVQNREGAAFGEIAVDLRRNSGVLFVLLSQGSVASSSYGISRAGSSP